MLTQHPHVAGHRDRCFRYLRNSVFIGLACGARFRILEEGFDLIVSEADDVEVEAVLLERLQFDLQHLFIPA